MKIEDFATLLAKLEFEPRRREKLRRNIPTWRFGFESISPVAEVSFNARFPRYPARWDGAQYWDGSAVPVDLDPDLALLLDFEEGEGSIAYDRVVRNRNNGTIYGAIFTTGVLGWGLSFDGVDDRVKITADPSIDIAGGDFTIDWWEFPTEAKSETIFSYSVTSYRFCIIHFPNFSDLYVYIANPTQYIFFYDVYPAINTWYSMVLCYSHTNQRLALYRNGAHFETKTGIIINGYTDEDLYIGRREVDNYGPYKGLIDEVRIYNRALSAGEIANHASLNYFNDIGVWG